ncbi:hypothetical protein HFO89_34695 [Rhizobium leguminosarum]|nr:hypothetical protein [Rhizobium leguminosarum]
MIGRHFIGSDLFQHGIGIAMPGQPFLRGLAISGEVDEFGVVAGAVEDPDVAELRALDHLECQAAVERERPVDTDRDDAIAAEIALMQREIRRQVGIADAALALFADQPALAVAVSQAASFFLWRSGGRGVPSDQTTIEPIGARS